MKALDLCLAPPLPPNEEVAGLCMLPRMIDITRAKLSGGHPGEYQVGRGLSGVVLQALGITASHFMAIVAGAENEHEIAQRVGLQEKRAVIRALSMRLRRLTVADVPSDLRPEFERYYGSN